MRFTIEHKLYHHKLKNYSNGFYRLCYSLDKEAKVDKICVCRYSSGIWYELSDIFIKFDKKTYTYELQCRLLERVELEHVHLNQLISFKNAIMKTSLEELDHYLQNYLFLKKSN